MANTLKLCDLKEDLLIDSPFINVIKLKDQYISNLSRQNIFAEDWFMYKKYDGKIFPSQEKLVFSVKNGYKITDLQNKTVKNSSTGESLYSGILTTVPIEPNSLCALSLRLKLNNPSIKILMIIDEYERLTNSGTCFSQNNPYFIKHNRHILKNMAFESEICFFQNIEFISSQKTKFLILSLEFLTNSLKDTLSETLILSLGNIEFYKCALTKDEELAWIHSHYKNFDKYSNELLLDQIKKKMSVLNAGAQDQEYRTILLAPAPTTIEYKLTVPAKGKLDFGYSLLNESWARYESCIQFSVYLREEGKQEVEMFSDSIEPRSIKFKPKWKDAEVNLSSYQNKKVSIVFKTKDIHIKNNSSAHNNDRYGYSAWSNPIVYADIPTHDDFNVILISLDALIMSHLGCYGYKKRATSPNIDTLAKNGTKFNQCITASNWTLPSHMAMFTSNYPMFFKKWYSEYSIGKEVSTIAEILSNEGYVTAAFTGNAWLNEESLSKGFDVYHSRWADKSEEMEMNLQDIIKFIEKNTGKFFIFWHSYETHHPFLRKTFLTEEMTKDLNFDLSNPKSVMQYLKKFKKGLIRPSEQEIELMTALLDSSIRYADNLIKMMLDKINAMGLLENTIVVFTADHGNHLLSETKHASVLTEQIIRVPLIIKSNYLPKGKIVDAQTKTIDIAPTILDLLGMPIPKEMEGSSLKPLISAEENLAPASIAFTMMDMGTKSEKFSARNNQSKLVYSPGDNSTEFYDLQKNYNKNNVSELSDTPEGFKKEALKFIFSHLPHNYFYLVFFGKNNFFTGDIYTTGKFCNDVFMFFREKSDLFTLNNEANKIEFKLNFSDGIKALRFNTTTLQRDSLTVNILNDGKNFRTDGIHLGQNSKYPSTNPFEIASYRDIIGYGHGNDIINKLANETGCLFYYLAYL